MRRSLVWILVAIPLLAEGQTQMHVPSTMRVLTHREQVPLVRSWIEKRFEVLLPELMRREGIDMWIIVTREYNSASSLPLYGALDDLLLAKANDSRLLRSTRSGGCRAPLHRTL